MMDVENQTDSRQGWEDESGLERRKLRSRGLLGAWRRTSEEWGGMGGWRACACGQRRSREERAGD